MAKYTNSNSKIENKKTNISIISFNSRGFDMGKQDFCKELLMDNIFRENQSEIKICAIKKISYYAITNTKYNKHW